MSTEISKQILARLQDEMSRNISSIKQKISEWLDRPQAGGLESLRDSMGEISGGLSMLNRPEAAELSNEIMAVIVALQKAVNEAGDIKPVDFDSAGAEVASAILVLDDYIDRLDEKQRDDGETIREILRVLQSLKEDTASRSSFSAPPKITKDTYKALAAKVSEVIETSRNQIEQYAHDPERPFNASSLITHNKNLINMFAVLDLKEPQLLLQKINQMLVEQLSEKQWIDVAEAMILVEETLNQVQSHRSPVVSTYAEAVAEQTRHSRELEVNNLVRDTGEVAFRFFEAMRKKVVHDERIHVEQGWRDAALRLAHYSAIAELVELLPLAEVLKNMGKSYAAISLQNKVDVPIFASVVDSLVGAEYIFFELSESGHPSKQDIIFLREAVESISRYIPVTQEAERLFAGFIDADIDIENSRDEHEDLSSAFSNILSGSLDALDRFGAPVVMQATTDDTMDEAAQEVLSPSMVHVASVGKVTSDSHLSSLDNITIQGNIAQETVTHETMPSHSGTLEGDTIDVKESTTSIDADLTAVSEPKDLSASSELREFVTLSDIESSAQSSAVRQDIAAFIPFFHGKSMADLDILPVPESKKDFVNAHADAVMDDEIRDFFVEELAELIELVNKVYPQWLENPDSLMLTTELRRAFHTLKGSGRTVGYESLGEFAWQHEQLLNRVLDNHYRANRLVQSTVGDAIELLNILKNQEEFSEHQGALLQQAAVAEAVREALMQDREIGENKESFFDASKKLRLHEDQVSDLLASINEGNVVLPEKEVMQIDEDLAVSHAAAQDPIISSPVPDATLNKSALSDEGYEQNGYLLEPSATVDVHHNERQDLEVATRADSEFQQQIDAADRMNDANLFDLVEKNAEDTGDLVSQDKDTHEDDWISPFSLADETEETFEDQSVQTDAVTTVEDTPPFELLPHDTEPVSAKVDLSEVDKEEALVENVLFSLVGEEGQLEQSASSDQVGNVALRSADAEEQSDFLDETLSAEKAAEALSRGSVPTDNQSNIPVSQHIFSSDATLESDAHVAARIVKTLQKGLGNIPEAERADIAINVAMEKAIKRQLAQEWFDDPAKLTELAKAVRSDMAKTDATLVKQAEDIFSRIADSADEPVEIDFTDIDFSQELTPIDPRAEQVVRMLEQGLAEKADDARLSAALLKHQLSDEVLSNSSKLDALLAEISEILNGMPAESQTYGVSEDFGASVVQISQIIEEGLALGNLNADEKEALVAAVRRQLTYPPASLQDSDALKEAVGARLGQNDILSAEDVQDVLQGAFVRVARGTEPAPSDMPMRDSAVNVPASPLDALQALDDAAVSTLRKTLQKALSSGHVDESVAAGIGMALAHQWQQNNLPLDDAGFATIAARLRKDSEQDSGDVEIVLQALAKRLGVAPVSKIDDTASPVSIARETENSSFAANDWLGEVVADDADEQTVASRNETLFWDNAADVEHTTASAVGDLIEEPLFALDVDDVGDAVSDASSDSSVSAEAPHEEAVIETERKADNSAESDIVVPAFSPMIQDAFVPSGSDNINVQSGASFAQVAEEVAETAISHDEDKTVSDFFDTRASASPMAELPFEAEDAIHLPFDPFALPVEEDAEPRLSSSGLPPKDTLAPTFSEVAVEDYENTSGSLAAHSSSQWMDMVENIPQSAVSISPSVAAQRLSRELEELSQHPALNDAVNRSSSGAISSVRSGPAVFLHAVDKFETLSQQVENSNDPDAINELIESVYDIEDSIEPETAPDWIWRMLDAVEQLLLMYKYQGAAVSLSAASILRQSAHLIEHHRDQESEDEALETINSLISARQERSRMSSTQQDMPLAHPASSFAGASYSEELVHDPNANSVLSETFLDEAMALFGRGQLDAEKWDEDLSRVNILDRIRRDMHTLKGSARMAGYMAIGDLTHAVESLIDNILDGYSEASPRAAAILSGAMWQGMIMLDNIRDGYLPQIDPYILNNISDYLKQPLPYPEIAEREKEAKELQRQEAEDAHFRALEEVTRPVEAEASTKVTEAEEVFGEGFDSDIDPVLVDIFSDEAEELLQATEVHLESDIANPGVAEEFKRTMHTLKGGARLVGLTAMGDTSHLMESVMEKVPELSEGKVRQAKILLQAGYESLRTMLDAVLRQEMPKPANAVNHALELFVREGRFETPKVETAAGLTAETGSSTDTASLAEERSVSEAVADDLMTTAERSGDMVSSVDAQEKVEPAIQAGKSAVNEQEVAAQEALAATEAQPVSAPIVSTEKAVEAVSPPVSQLEAAQEKSGSIVDEKEKTAQDQDRMSDVSRFVRVDSQLLDEIIAMVGEASIMRSRIENISAGVEFNIGELTRISTRIAEQMRRLDNETEAQMLFRREKQGSDDEHFDPLEMDRFTEIQQLSRQLSEAIDDLKNVQDTLANDNTVLRNLASQQGIIQRSLQDRLLTTQLMRFDVNEPRLKRLVRQTAKTLGKEVHFVLEGGQVELERRLLEDVLPALEHMIRNAIAHGIETPAQRRQAGKPEIGTIKLVVGAQSSEVTMRLIDDGHGFDYDRIRGKAREKGILDESLANDTQYLNSLILRSGFSTAQSLTQISGRGVGMDVVNEMVKQRRGRLSADSLPGKGTEFTVVMPFSMSIAEVLLVDIGGRTYAAPMSSITAVSQVSRTDLQESLSGELVYHRYGDRDYRLYVLGSYFEPGNYEFTPEAHQLPVLFIDSGDEAVAFHVDRILNRLEIIVKNVNRQVLNIPGISGATILGDASVVPVLELMDLARRIGTIVPYQEEVPEESTEKRILVVDDSVTMRKVSTRLLERNHFIVETAKDGLDAIDVLQHFKPDLIMLDIEMPRMDGFEFAAHVRQNSDVPNVPIVMVTSRTGDKHRERAGQIGVQGYLGKPYREDILMETLNSLLNTTIGVTS